MHELYELKEQLLDELKEYRSKQKKTIDDLMVIKYLTSSIDHLCNIIMAAEEEEYSGRGGQGGGNYSRENRYSREGMGGGSRYSREGSYARGRNARRDSMGRYAREGGYSRAGGIEDLVEDIQSMMQELPQNMQQEAQKFVQKLEQQM